MNRYHLVIFQHEYLCLVGNILGRLTVLTPLIALILFSYNTDSRDKENA